MAATWRTYQPTPLPTYQPTPLPTYQPTPLPTHQPTPLSVSSSASSPSPDGDPARYMRAAGNDGGLVELTGEEEEGGGDEDEQEEPGLRLAGGAAHEQQERQAGARAAAGTEPGVTSLLMLGKGMVPVEREARMLKEKLRFMTWKMLRLPALLPSVMGWEKRQLREVKRVQREQAGRSVMELPPVGFQKPKGELAEYGVSSSDAAALMAAAVEEAGDVDKKIGNMATAASAVHFGPRAWYLLHRQGLGEDQDNRQRRHVDGREGQ